MPGPRNELCARCFFAEPVAGEMGICRKRPPSVHLVLDPSVGNGETPIAQVITGWPQVSLLSDWCGDFQVHPERTQ
jgi:hypothetical protein